MTTSDSQNALDGANGVIEVTTGRLSLIRTIGHKIVAPRAGEDRHSAIVANNLLNQDVEIKTMLKKRVAMSLGKRSKTLNLRFTRFGSGTFFPLAAQALEAATDSDFIEASQAIANLLAENHRRGLSDGLLIVAQASLGQVATLVLIKADRQEGIKGSVDESQNAVVHLLNDLFLTGGSRLHKVVLIVQASETVTPDTVRALLYDGSLRKQDDLRAAQYFLEDFLGAEIALEGRRETYTFFQRARQVLEEVSCDAAQKYELNERLTKFMLGPRDLFTPEEFVSEAVPSDLQNEVERRLRAYGVPDQAIVRDNQDINKALETTMLELEGGIKLIVPQAIDAGRFSIRSELGRTVITIDDLPTVES